MSRGEKRRAAGAWECLLPDFRTAGGRLQPPVQSMSLGPGFLGVSCGAPFWPGGVGTGLPATFLFSTGFYREVSGLSLADCVWRWRWRLAVGASGREELRETLG